MKNNMTGKMKAALLVVVLLSTACGNNDNVIVRGTFSGIGETPIYLNQRGINATIPVDSLTPDEKGRFKFNITLPDKQPAFYTLNCDGQTITLLLSPGERVEVKSLGNLANNYLVEGSEGSEQVRELNQLLISNRRSLDSLADLYFSLSPDDTATRSALARYNRLFVQQKRSMISFVVKNANSLSSVYALYQRMPNGEWFFSDDRDMSYFQMVSDSLSKRYPASPHVISLQKDVLQMEKSVALAEMLNSAAVSEMNYPDIELADVFGKRTKLSSLGNNVILVDFWISTETASRLLNAELAELYAEYHDKGFEIYQVSLDENRLAWVTAVQEQKIPWVTVCDFKGQNSPAARIYNVNRLPANVLINRQGEIVGRDIPMAQLSSQIDKLL